MSAPARPQAERRMLYRSGWLVVVFAMCSYLLIAYAEQGSAGAGMSLVPDDPLPFERHSSAGVDLSRFSSLAALEWIESVDVSGATLVVLPIDGDIVAAFNNPETFVAARTAVDQLVAATDGIEIAVCLKRPISAIDEAILAEAAVTALVENYSERITYIGACGQETSTSWESSVLSLLSLESPGSATERLLAPVTLGAPLLMQMPVAFSEVDGAYLDGLSGESYVAIRLLPEAGLDDEMREDLARILHDRPQVATILAAPSAEADPASFIASLSLEQMQFQELSEGFNNISSPHIDWNGNWTRTDVGPVAYQRTLETGSWLTAEFIGTEIWAVGIVSPDGGRLGVWIDAEESSATGEPERVVPMTRTQARDQSVLLADRLPAARHRITIVAADGEVALSGLFVAGRPEAGWHGVLGSIGLIVATVAGLGVVLTAAVDDLRHRIGLESREGAQDEHPRVFRRDL